MITSLRSQGREGFRSKLFTATLRPDFFLKSMSPQYKRALFLFLFPILWHKTWNWCHWLKYWSSYFWILRVIKIDFLLQLQKFICRFLAHYELLTAFFSPLLRWLSQKHIFELVVELFLVLRSKTICHCWSLKT